MAYCDTVVPTPCVNELLVAPDGTRHEVLAADNGKVQLDGAQTPIDVADLANWDWLGRWEG